MAGTANTAAGGWMSCNVDLGSQETVELDYRSSEPPWLSIGSGISAADIWLQGRSGLPDIRFRIERTESGLQVHLDRGDQSNIWWPKEAPPRLSIAFDQGAATATAVASVGMAQDFQEVDLGTTAF